MKKIALLLVTSSMLFTSCATIFNKKEQKISFYGEDPNSTMVYKDSVYQLPVKLKIPRSKENLEVTYSSDKQTDISIKKRLDFKFVPGNIFWIYGSGIAYLIDARTPKKYKYPSEILLTHEVFEDKKIHQKYQNQYFGDHAQEIKENPLFIDQQDKDFYYKHNGKKKGDTFHVINLFSLNVFDYKTATKSLSKAGSFTIGYGFEKFYTDRMFWSSEIVLRTNRFDLFLSELDNFKENASQLGLSFHNNHLLNKSIEVGYGIKASYNSFSYENYEYNYINGDILLDARRYNERDRFVTAGLSFRGAFKVGGGYYIGLTVAPDFVKFADYGTSFQMNNTTAIDLKLKF